MAGELVGYGASGVTHDFFAFNAANEVWNGSAFVAWMDGDYATYRITATEQGTSTEFVGDAPTGTTRFQLRIRSGTLAGSGIVWAESIAPPTTAQIASAVATYAGGDIMGADALYQMVFTARDEAAAAAAAVSGSGNTLGSIPWNPDWDAEVQSEVHDALLAFPVASQATSQLIFNLLDTEVAEILEDTSTTLPALIAAGGGGGLTAQQVRDAMKLAPTAGDPATGSVDKHLDDIEAKTNTIGAARVTVTAPVATTGTLTLVRGDSYYAADGRSLDWVDAGDTWPTLTGATITFKAFSSADTPDVNAAADLTATGSVIVGSGSGKQVRVELTDAETALLTERAYTFQRGEYQVLATLASGHVITLVMGRLVVQEGG